MARSHNQALPERRVRLCPKCDSRKSNRCLTSTPPVPRSGSSARSAGIYGISIRTAAVGLLPYRRSADQLLLVASISVAILMWRAYSTCAARSCARCPPAAGLRHHRVCAAKVSPTRSASEDVFACAMFDVTAMTMPLSRPVISDITIPPASSPLTLPVFVASAKRTRSDGVE